MPVNMHDRFTRLNSAKTLGQSYPLSKVVLFLVVSLGLALFSAGYWLLKAQSVFSTTSSPNHTYTVSLKGSKARALLMRNEVRADVSKEGQPFISDIWLHSARNAFDLSFEVGYPDVRWPTENLVEFYRQQYFEKGFDLLTVRNSSRKPIKYIRVQSLNKFLLFDFEPGTSVSLRIPSPRGDSQWIAVEGVFSDGQIVPFNHQDFDRRSTQLNRFEYQIEISSSGSSINSTEDQRSGTQVPGTR